MFTFPISHFGMARKASSKGDGPKAVDVYQLNALAAERGYIVHPDCCTNEVMEWLNWQTANYNATFYEQWKDITCRSRLQLLMDQLIHYASTYGTQMQGTPYVPNENIDSELAALHVPSFKELKMILPVSDEDLYEKCLQALRSGIALNANTLREYVDYICYYANDSKIQLDVNSFKNRDAICMVSSALGILPSDTILALRTLVYSATRSTAFVQNTELVRQIQSGNPVDFSKLSKSHIHNFATIFNRFKRIFLAFKVNQENNPTVINRIGKLSKTLHQPMVKGFWESILEEEKSMEEIAAQLKIINNFKKVRIMQLVMERLAPSKDQVYVIRNGKTFVRMGYTAKAVSESYCHTLYAMLRESLVESLRSKACPIKLPQHCELTLPSSEKTFVGNIPFGTSFKMADHNIVGIYWRNEWGTHDFDLSLLDLNANRIGWNANYCKGNDVIYSGDMTNAEPEATELIYMSKKAPDSVVCVNRFNGNEGSKFRLFFAQENLSETQELCNYMVDPNSVKWDVMMESEKAQQTIGLICDNTFYMMDLQTSNARVSSNNDYQKAFIETMKNRTKHFVMLADILKDAGFTIVDKGAAIDFTDLKKDILIKLMAA